MLRKLYSVGVLFCITVITFGAQNTQTAKKSDTSSINIKAALTHKFALSNTGPTGPVTQVLEFHFNKKFGDPNSCMIQEKMNGGNTLRCPIDLDAVGASGRILDMHGECSPQNSDPCRHTAECPGGGICDLHLYRSEPDPNKLMNGNFRQANWFGWTDDGNKATLIIRVYVGS